MDRCKREDLAMQSAFEFRERGMSENLENFSLSALNSSRKFPKFDKSSRFLVVVTSSAQYVSKSWQSKLLSITDDIAQMRALNSE